ncbi:hypothetical protein TAMA11512_18820 [Selenomonas sp. TAMA-11512]|nr:hypothetical protein TAMA11512_02260 [Selenomonas sp. TAMA-11512]BEU87144.1 hypothetical protein TAMA11512_06080 [Selenomonas sp. TAMA-11512]BEU87387.1 hypothetical protein TAMA11512_08510 [Selenomonas sp. TAMA-11512]BEU87412.1 hypothetical protein TAMA11512_08760 [Selenomonas sp. TAMA-11512]BEU87871.1 hypothetical protein TAMA11512_13350 [Selenomonas sp. TAMA-11512]
MAIKLDGIDACLKFMWQIAFDLCYTGHGDETSFGHVVGAKHILKDFIAFVYPVPVSHLL